MRLVCVCAAKDNEYLIKTAGDSVVQVEQRASSAAPFGTAAPKVRR